MTRDTPPGSGTVTFAGRIYRVADAWGANPCIWSQIPESNTWRQTPAVERRLKSGSPLFRDVLDAFRFAGTQHDPARPAEQVATEPAE